MSYDQIPSEDAFREKLLTPYTVANVYKLTSYFEAKGNIRFETIPDESGLGDAIIAFLRFSSGAVALIGARPTTMNRGVELLCSGSETEALVLSSFKEAFPEISDAELCTRDKWVKDAVNRSF